MTSRKTTIAAAFSRAAATYDQHATLQRQTAARLAALIATLPIPPTSNALEIGCGTGLLTTELQTQLPHASRIITDLSPAMVQHCRARLPGAPDQFLALDGEAPPFAAPTFHLICASLALQWFEHPAAALRRLHDLLTPAGWLAFATLGPGSLPEWRQSHADENLPPPTPAFPPPERLAAGWPAARLEHARLTIPHPSGRAFLASLRGIGAGTPRPGHQPLRPAELARVLARFDADHQARCTYDIAYLLLPRIPLAPPMLPD